LQRRARISLAWVAQPCGLGRCSSVEPISFARGIPAPECLPVSELADCARAAIERDDVDLVVEVSSPSTIRHDLVRKRRVFEQFGVPEFWFVNLDAERIEIYRLVGESFADPVFVMRGERLTSPLLPGFELNVDQILGPPPPA